MKTKLIPAVVVAAQIFLGNFCMMPLASAMEAMPMDHDEMQDMEQVTEMVMSPANAMSSLHCEGCVTISRPRHHDPDMGSRMPCNDGHCLSEHTPSVVSVTQSPLKDALKTAILPASFIYSEPRKDVFDDGWNQRPPIQVTFVQTIVLRE